MFKWASGGQNFTYKKFALIKLKIFDCYLLKINPWAKIPWHIDSIDNYKHYRINILLRGQYTQLYEKNQFGLINALLFLDLILISTW